MKRYFKGGITTLGGMFLTLALMITLMVITPENSGAFNAALGVFTFTMCTSPLVVLFTVITGIGALVDWNSNRNQVKKKNDFQTDFADFDFGDSANMDAIMERLTPAQQDYLQEQLRDKRLGVGSDGELTSMDDLLNRFEDDNR